MPEEPKPRASGLEGTIRWIVLGVVILAFMFLFRNEIANLLSRTTSLDVSKSGIKLVAAQTVVGQTNVTNVPVKLQGASQGISGNTFTDVELGFQISWPGDGDWMGSEEVAKNIRDQFNFPPTVSLPIVVLKNQPVGGIRPSVNVTVEPVGQMGIKEYVEASLANFAQNNMEERTQTIDEATQSAVLSSINRMTNHELYQVQRIVISRGKAFVATATQVPPNAGERLRSDIREVLNSFRVTQ